MIEHLYSSELYWAYASLAGFLTGLAYAMGGSGGLIITPFLIASGMPIHMAIGSAKIGSLGLLTTVFWKFKSSDKVQWNYFRPLIVLAILGAIIGSGVTLNLDKDIIYPIVGLFLIILAPLALMNKNFGLKTFIPSMPQKISGYLAFLLVMIFGGFFGAGAGIPGIFALCAFLGMTTFQAHATQVIPLLVVNIISSVMFAWYGQVDYLISFVLLIGMTAGGWIGAKIALKGSDKFVKIFTFTFAFLIGLKMVWEGFM